MTSMNVLILGDRADPHAAHVGRAVAESGAAVHYCNTQSFPARLQLSWRPDTHEGALILPGGQRLDLHQIHSVFWRNFAGVQVPPLQDAWQTTIASKDAMSALRSVFQACPAHWVNSWQAYQFHQAKPLQLQRVAQLGVMIPDTLISNDPHAVLTFCAAHTHTIFKPVCGGAHTQLVTPEHLQMERLQLALKLAPVTLQEYIPGTNVRSYVIGSQVYTAEICSEAIDFREDEAARLIPMILPDRISQQCIAIARSLWLEWTAIDWRLTPDGKYVFLEANPSPMFLHFEQQTGFPITQQLVEQLTARRAAGAPQTPRQNPSFYCQN